MLDFVTHSFNLWRFFTQTHIVNCDEAEKQGDITSSHRENKE